MNCIKDFLGDKDAMANPLAKDLKETAEALAKLKEEDLHSLFGALLMTMVDREILAPTPAALVAKTLGAHAMKEKKPHA